ncbi:3-oxosteroid 1-dehydrogenase [Aspergillus udagawae]|nr:3-oxosteroid 1-dehydrogenase [Aspergillus udagawae]GFG20164.1 3-oxosteroid 1-dehydrogenase [Aspergillus udagawae]
MQRVQGLWPITRPIFSSRSAAIAVVVPTRPLSTTATRHNATSEPHVDEVTDVLIIGSGAGALTASLRATKLGLRNIVVEKEEIIGGASAISGGGLWIPCNPVSRAAGIHDSEEKAMLYFEQAVGEVGPASSIEKRKAYITNGPKMVEFLQQQGFQFHFARGYPDYYPAMSGAMGQGGGRTIETKPFNVNKLKDWQSKLPPTLVPVAIHTNDVPVFARATSSLSAFFYAFRKILPLVAKALAGQKLASMGRGLVAQLLYLNLKHQGGDIRIRTSLSSLIQSPAGDVLGAQVRSPEGLRSIRATRGVVLAAGGFAHNREMRQRFMPQPASTEWTNSPAGDTGDAIQEGMRIGAKTALLDDAWWGPTVVDPVSGQNSFALIERAQPHSFIVDSTGSRFMNEAQSYTDAGHDQYARNQQVKAIPAWLIIDSNHRNKYMLAGLFPRVKPSKKALSEGKIFQAASIKDLACQIGVDAVGLSSTTERFNNMCIKGVDEDFGRGTCAYDQFFGDPTCRPNPNLGPLNKAPYYAIRIWPGDLGTKGGLVTDEFQRVLNQQLRPISGLFAIGNTAASIMGRTYLGAGSTLGPAMTHGYIVASYLAGSSS